MVNGPSPGPAPAAQARASNFRLTRSSWRTWPHRKLHRKLRRKVPRVDGALTAPGCPAGAQHIGVVDAVAAGQRGGHQRHYLVAGVGPAWGPAQVQMPVNQLGQAQVLGEGGRQDQAGIGHQAAVVKDDADTVGIVLWQHLLGAPCFWLVFCSKTIIPDSEEHPFTSGSGKCTSHLGFGLV